MSAANQQADVAQQIGVRLRALRQQNRWSLDRAAEASGVSKAMLGQIERGESSPTIATLWKIATGFAVPMSSLIEDSPVDGVVQREPQLRRVDISEERSKLWKPLFPYDASTGIEVFVIDLPPGQERFSPAHQAGVTEHIIVISGRLDFCLDNKWQVIQTGEGLRFRADRAHGYRNAGDCRCSFHNIIHYSKSVC